jgi:hypothetical protein
MNFFIYAGIGVKALCSWRSLLFSAKVGSRR